MDLFHSQSYGKGSEPSSYKFTLVSTKRGCLTQGNLTSAREISRKRKSSSTNRCQYIFICKKERLCGNGKFFFKLHFHMFIFPFPLKIIIKQQTAGLHLSQGKHQITLNANTQCLMFNFWWQWSLKVSWELFLFNSSNYLTVTPTYISLCPKK